jgi:mannose-6-phosphate isomerase
VYRLENPVRHYAWGSRTHLPKLLGVHPDGEPWAELWLGAHPSAPSRVAGDGTLDRLIAAEAETLLGPQLRGTFGDRLPFLMKLLAAAEPLSLQVHPTSERARIRHAAQDAAGIPLDAPERTYPDSSHKPELIYALTRFEGMAGFRDPVKTAAILRGLQLPWLDETAATIEASTTPFQTLRGVVTDMLSLKGQHLSHRLQQLRAAAAAAELRLHAVVAGRRGSLNEDPTAVERESVRVYAAVTQLVDRYPHDPGVLVTLLLNHVVLAPGEAMFIDAGVIHAYTSGFGVEIMAASDNVLRAGLTPKHVDIPELLEVTNFTPMPPPLWAATGDATTTVLSPPVAEFELLVHTLASTADLPATAQVVLCLEGQVTVSTSAGSETLRVGESVFVGAGDGAATIDGHGRVAVGRPAG